MFRCASGKSNSAVPLVGEFGSVFISKSNISIDLLQDAKDNAMVTITRLANDFDFL